MTPNEPLPDPQPHTQHPSAQSSTAHPAAPAQQSVGTSPKLDDIEAVRSIVVTLSAFPNADRERILRWVLEKLGIALAPPPAAPTPAAVRAPQAQQPLPEMQPARPAGPSASAAADIKSFVASKNPTSDNKFAATVAYYHQFIAPEAERHDTIQAKDLTEACRKAERRRIARPDQVLVNAYQAGYIDRPRTGTYKLNSVGENLVAFVLPEGARAETAAAAQPVVRAHRAALPKKETRGSKRKKAT